MLDGSAKGWSKLGICKSCKSRSIFEVYLKAIAGTLKANFEVASLSGINDLWLAHVTCIIKINESLMGNQ